MNVETVLAQQRPRQPVLLPRLRRDGWSLEHIHAQNSQGLKKENQRRDWLDAHVKKIRATDVERRNCSRRRSGGGADRRPPRAARRQDRRHRIPGASWTRSSRCSAPRAADATEEDMHGLGNLALLQRDFNSKLNNAVFALKRERILELDEAGAYILPCTRNVFLKYYTARRGPAALDLGPAGPGRLLREAARVASRRLPARRARGRQPGRA